MASMRECKSCGIAAWGWRWWWRDGDLLRSAYIHLLLTIISKLIPQVAPMLLRHWRMLYMKLRLYPAVVWVYSVEISESRYIAATVMQMAMTMVMEMEMEMEMEMAMEMAMAMAMAMVMVMEEICQWYWRSLLNRTINIDFSRLSLEAHCYWLDTLLWIHRQRYQKHLRPSRGNVLLLNSLMMLSVIVNSATIMTEILFGSRHHKVFVRWCVRLIAPIQIILRFGLYSFFTMLITTPLLNLKRYSSSRMKTLMRRLRGIMITIAITIIASMIVLIESKEWQFVSVLIGMLNFSTNSSHLYHDCLSLFSHSHKDVTKYREFGHNFIWKHCHIHTEFECGLCDRTCVSVSHVSHFCVLSSILYAIFPFLSHILPILWFVHNHCDIVVCVPHREDAEETPTPTTTSCGGDGE